MTHTFYTYDSHECKYLRLAVVDSVGLMYQIGNEVLIKLYKENVFYMQGIGKAEIKRTDPLIVAGKLNRY